MADIIKDVAPATELEGHLIVSNEYEAIDLEGHRERPRRKRGMRRFLTVNGFCAYVSLHKNADSVIYGDRERAAIDAVLNDHGSNEPGHGDHAATLRLLPHRDRLAWEGASRAPVSQSALIDLIDEQMHTIAHPPAADLAEMLATLKVARNTKVESVKDLRTGNTRATFHDEETGATSSADIPGRINLQVKLFECSERPSVVTVKLGWRLVEKRVQFQLKLIDLEQAVEAEETIVDAAVEKGCGIKVWR